MKGIYQVPGTFFLFPIPFVFFALICSLLPSHNSNPGSHGRLFSPLTATVRALHFYREKISVLRTRRLASNCAYALSIGLPPVRLLPGYPAGLPGRVLPATGSGSDPKPAVLFGSGTRIPVQQRVPVVSMPDDNLQKPFKHAANEPAVRLAQYLLLIASTHAATTTIHDHGYLGPGTRLATCPRGHHA